MTDRGFGAGGQPEEGSTSSAGGWTVDAPGPDDSDSRRGMPSSGSSRTTSPDDVAAAVLDGVPLIMRALRGSMREGRPAGMSVAQFRALFYIRRRPGTGLSEIADHLGTSVPAASELVSRLVREDLVRRAPDPIERRRVRLTLSSAGIEQLDRAQGVATSWVRGMVEALDPARQQAIVDAIADLRRLVLACPPAAPDAPSEEKQPTPSAGTPAEARLARVPAAPQS